MSLIAELKRRNVFRVGIAYIVMSWVLLQAADFALDLIGAPNWVIQSLFVIVAIGLPVALFFAWAFELTPDGVKRESQVDRSESVTPQTRRKLDYLIISGVVLIAAYFIWEARFQADSPTGGDRAVASETSAEVVAESPAELVTGNSIAVLPFANRSNVDEDLFFTDGIHDDLLTQLAKIGDLKVISRTSVMEYREATKKIAEIAAELGVSKILEGGVQRAGDRIRINAQLIDVATDQHLWAETFNREMTIDNIFDIQTEITTQIVTAVKGKLSDSERATLTNRPTDNLEAWEAILHARAIVAETDYGADKYRRAETFARQAVTLDPQFAQAWAELAMVQLQGIWIGYANTPEQREQVRESLLRAETLAPDDPWVKKARADYQYRAEVDYPASLESIREAIALAPGNSELFHDLATVLRRLGRWDESIAAFEKTLELDPLNAFAAATLIETLAMMNEWTRVDELSELWLRRKPDSSDLLSFRGQAMVNLNGDVQGAYELLSTAPAGRSGRASGFYGDLAAMQGDWDSALEADRRGGFLDVFDITPDLRQARRYMQKGEIETARGHIEAYLEHTRQTSAYGRLTTGFRNINLAEIYALSNDHAAARHHAELAVEAVPADFDHVFGLNIDQRYIRIMALVGERDLALERIAAKLDKPEGFSRWELYLDPAWDFFRDDARFNALALPDGVEPDAFRAQRRGDDT